MPKSFNTLSALVTEEMHREVLSGDLFVCISRDRKRAKVPHPDMGRLPVRSLVVRSR